MTFNQYYAAIDLGSRNCRLLISQVDEGKIIPIELQSRIVDLGEGINKTHRLSKRAMDRSIHVLKQYKRRLEVNQNIIYKCVATEACRRAVNQNNFIKRIEHEVGLTFDIIDFHQEAFYALKGCEPLIKKQTKYVLIFDIGGASTELIWASCHAGYATEVIDCISIPYGVITVSELFTHDLFRHYQETIQTVHQFAAQFYSKNMIDDVRSHTEIQLIGTSGTTTTMAALHLNLRFYDSQKVDNTLLTYQDVQNVIQQIQLMNPHERSVHPCIGSNREDLILGGVAIFDGLYRAWPELSICVTDRGVRDGIVSELVKNNNPESLI